MKIINRGFICVAPTPIFMEWALKNSDENQFFTSDPEPSIYLVEDDFWEDSLILEKYYKKIHKKILAKISEMASDNPVQLKKMVHSGFSYPYNNF